MCKANLLAASAAALTFALFGTAAWASGTVTSPLVDVNAAQLRLAGGEMVVPLNRPLADQVYMLTGVSKLQTGSSFTITLPGSLVFSAVPIPLTNLGIGFTVASGGVGTNSVTYLVGNSDVPAGGSINIGPFNISGATSLDFPYSSPVLPMTFQSTNNGLDGDLAPISVPVFTNAPGAELQILRASGGKINLASTPPGTQFVPDDVSTADAGAIATLTVSTELTDPSNNGTLVISPSGATNSLNEADTVTISVEGDFTGIYSAYASPTIGTCTVRPSGTVYTGAVTTEELSFAAIPINTPVQLCMVTDGVTLLHASPAPYIFSYVVDSGSDLDNGLPQSPVGSGFRYVGGTAEQVSNFFTGTDGGYASLLRVSNTGKGAATVVAEFQPFSGGPTLVGTLCTLSGGTGAIYSLAQIEAAVPGLDLTNSGQRAMLTVVGTGVNSNVTASAILINPGGIIGNIE